MTSFTFYGGAGEIGGNKILLSDGDVKAYLDFGEPFDFGNDYFYEWLKPRTANGLECYFEFGLLPRVKRLYSQRMLRFTDIPYEKPDIDAVFISHHHSDHVGHLRFLDESIPVHMGHGTKRLLDIYKKLYPAFSKTGDHESINLFRSSDEINVKHLTFKPVHVEHSTPGAYGYIIKKDEGNIVFTGDFRLHGPKREYSEEFIRKAAHESPQCMLCEGTRMGPEKERQYGEKEVYERVRGIIEDSRGLVFASFSMSNIDRFISVYNATKECGRTLVIDTKMAYFIESLGEKVDLPDVHSDGNLKVYFRLSKSCDFSEKDYYKFEREYLDNMITYREIKENPLDYVMFTNFNRLMELVYLQPKNADYIYSSSEHFLEGDENEDMRRTLENWLSHFKIAFHKAHCSGHASKKDIEYAVKKIKPDTLIPIHTQCPEEFTKIHDNVLIPKNGSILTISSP